MDHIYEDVWYLIIINLLDSEDIETCFLVNKLFNKICTTRISPLKLKRHCIGDKKYYKYFTDDGKTKGKILSYMPDPKEVLKRIAKKINIKGNLNYDYCIVSFKGKLNSYNGIIEVLENPVKFENIVYIFGNYRYKQYKIMDNGFADKTKIIRAGSNNRFGKLLAKNQKQGNLNLN